MVHINSVVEMGCSLKSMLLVLFAVLLAASPAMAVHVHGSGSFVSVSTDGFDDGYYLAVWTNTSGVFGRMYYVLNNTPVGDTIQLYDSESYFTAVASSKIDNTEAADNLYLVVWEANDSYPHVRFLGYDGSFRSNSIKLSNPVEKIVDVAYGMGYFVVVYEGASPNDQNLYYAIFGKDTSLVEEGTLYTFPGEIASPKIAFDQSSGYFGVFIMNRDSEGNQDSTFLVFRVNSDGTLDKKSIQTVTVLDNVDVYGNAIAPVGDGFVVAYEKTDYKWYTRLISVTTSGLSVGKETGPFYKEDGDTAGGWASMDLVYNATSGNPEYVIFVYENQRGNDNVYELVVQLLDTKGAPLNGNLNGDNIIQGGKNSYRVPAVAVKPSRSPEAYIVSWIDSSQSQAEGSEYLPDFTEVSESNTVPFFSNAAVGIGLIGGALLLFRRR